MILTFNYLNASLPTMPQGVCFWHQEDLITKFMKLSHTRAECKRFLDTLGPVWARNIKENYDGFQRNYTVLFSTFLRYFPKFTFIRLVSKVFFQSFVLMNEIYDQIPPQKSLLNTTKKFNWYFVFRIVSSGFFWIFFNSGSQFIFYQFFLSDQH